MVAAIIVHLWVRRTAPWADPVILPVAVALNGLGLAMIQRLDMAYKTRAGGDPGGTSPAEANRDGDGAGEPAAEAKPAKPKARVFVAPNLERLVADSRRQPDVAHSGSEWTLPDAEVILDPVPENNDNQQDPEFIRRSTEIIEEVF